MKVLLVGHACCPEAGSEPGLTWNWAWHLSALHEVYVMTHPQYRARIEEYLRRNPNMNLRFVWVTLDRMFDPWNPTRGERGIKLHYLLWNRAALRAALRLHAIHHFDVVHHVSWGTVSAPPLLWKLPIPFVWGPVGGGMTSPSAFRDYFGEVAYKEWLRDWRIRLLPRLTTLRHAVRRSSLILATNQETVDVLEAAGARGVRLLFDNGLPTTFIPTTPPEHNGSREVKIFWAGRLEPRKALKLALEAVAQVGGDFPVRLVVAGEGPLRGEAEGCAHSLGIAERVDFLGAIPRDKMIQTFQDSDMFLFTSLRDSFGSVVLEAMSQALPVIILSHQGVGKLVPTNAGIKVPVTTPRQVVAELAQGIRSLAGDHLRRREMGQAAWGFARTQTWSHRAEQMSHWYEECVARAPRRTA